MLRSRITDAASLEDVIQIVRRAVKERDFFLSVATLEGRLDADAAGRQRTALAEAALSVLVPRVLADFATRFGRVPGGALAVVAMGKAGGREMMAGSDLDLMFIYDHPADVTESRGAPQPARQPVVRPRRAGLHRRADRAGSRRPDVCPGHAAAAVRATKARSPSRWRVSGATTTRTPGPGSAWR